MTDITALIAAFTAHNQEQVLDHYAALDPAAQASLRAQLAQIDPQRVGSIFGKAVEEARKREAGRMLTLWAVVYLVCP